MIVLALDIATTTGVAVGDSSAAPRAWSVHLGKGPFERRLSQMISLTSELIETHKPGLVAIEAPIGGKKVNKPLIALWGCAMGVCDLRRVKPKDVASQSVRAHFLDKNLTKRDFPGLSEKAARRAIKDAVIRRCQFIGWEPENDDEADALALWDYACATYVPGYQAAPSGGLFRQQGVGA